jgi:hypothetical protein
MRPYLSAAERVLFVRSRALRTILLCVLAASQSPALWAQAAPAARVVASSGMVSVQAAAGTSQIADVNTGVNVGDVVQTQANSTAILRYQDGTELRLSPRSRVTLAEFLLKPEKPEEERLSVRLLTGAMRVLSGAMAQRRSESATFFARTATAGIRGTDFTLRACGGEGEEACVVADDATVAQAAAQPDAAFELAGRVGAAAGGVSAIDAQGRWRVLEVSAPLRAGDRVQTGNTGVAMLILTDGTRVALDPYSLVWLRAYSWDERRPREGRVAMELVNGRAQVETGGIAKARTENFVFLAAGQEVRVHGTRFGTVVNAVTHAVNEGADRARDAANNAPSPSQVAITAMNNAAKPFLLAMTVQLDNLRNNPPQTEAAARAAGAAAQTLMNNLRNAVQAAMPSAAQTEEMRVALAALTVARWQFGVAIAMTMDSPPSSMPTTSQQTDCHQASTCAGGPPVAFVPSGPLGSQVFLPALNAELQVAMADANLTRALGSVGLNNADLQRARELTVQPYQNGSSLRVREFLQTETSGYFQNQNNDAFNRLNNAAQAVADATRTRLAEAEAAARTIVTNTGQQARAAGQDMGQALPTPPAIPVVPVAQSPNFGANTYDITGGKVSGSGGAPTTVTNGVFTTRITARVERQEDYNRTVIETVEVIEPPTMVRTADGRWLTGGTILRRVDRMAHGDSVTVSYVGLTFAAPGKPSGTLLTGCDGCNALIVSTFEPSGAGRGQSTNYGGGVGRPVQACTDAPSADARCPNYQPSSSSGNSAVASGLSSEGGSQNSQSSQASQPSSGQSTGQASQQQSQSQGPGQSSAPDTGNNGNAAHVQVTVMQGNVSIIGPGQSVLPLGAGESAAGPAASTGNSMMSKTTGKPVFTAPSPNVVQSIGPAFFGPKVGLATNAGLSAGLTNASQNTRAEAGVYVHVNDGAVALKQGGQEVVLQQGETAFAPEGGAPPVKVSSGVRVAGANLPGLAVTPMGESCRRANARSDAAWMASTSSAGMKNPAIQRPGLRTGSLMSRVRFDGNVFDKITAKDLDAMTAGANEGASGGNRTDKGFGPGFQSVFDQFAEGAKGKGLGGSGRLQGPKQLIGGRYADTFQGNRINNASGQDITLGGRPGRVGNIDGKGRVSSGEDDSVGDGRYIIGVTTAEEDAANEEAYSQAVGTDGYQATKDMTYGQRESYWRGERDSQMTGGVPMTPEQAAAQRDNQMRGNSGRPREDENVTAGGSGIPIFLRRGQFGNEIRGVQKAISTKTGAAGGSGDGRIDQQAQGGSTGGMMMQRSEQLGVTRAEGAGNINWDKALVLNPLVNPGAQ